MLSQNSQQLKHKTITYTSKCFLAIAVIIIGFATYYYQSEKTTEYTTHSIDELSTVKHEAVIAKIRLKEVWRDVILTAKEPKFEQIINHPKLDKLDNLKDLEEKLSDLATVKQDYEQIRWIDETGMERIRVNFKNNTASVTPNSELQDKSDRYYFKDTMKFDIGEVYASPLDLNIEHNAIEVPYKPTIRFATPVADQHGNKKGIIIINFIGQKFLNEVVAAIDTHINHTMLLNRNGYYLVSEHAKNNWGFMFNRDDLTLAKSNPKAWARINLSDRGQFLDEDGLWTFRTVYPAPYKQQSAQSKLQSAEYKWKIVSRLPTQELYKNSTKLGTLLIYVVTVLLSLLFWFCWRLGRYQAENAFYAIQQKIAATVFESQEGMMVTDANKVILRVNSAFTKITGFSAEDSIGKTPSIVNSGRQDATFYTAMWQSINNTGAWEGEIWNKRKSGEIYPEHRTITAIKDNAGIVTNYVTTFTDITLSKAASDKIKNLAFYDTLTHLANRRLLIDRLNQTLSLCKRNHKHAALMFLDLDNFKPLNDTHGHMVGDLLLIEVARRLESCVREVDTVARFGGDEFVVMLSELDVDRTTSLTEAKVVAEKIRTELSKPYLLTIMHDHQPDSIIEHTCTCSIGVVIFDGSENSQEALTERADNAMYDAKQAGRNQVRFYDKQV
ncbi:cyclic di-GMP phosphodiesterase Gmr [mine drainage metagenome]|uniref:Cyclic di-GMP phosphodiesterase Gmr n=1 Tax=mine drainage metagenome TaxID=410659 RepID=A0A1J5SLR7_9ZZZZ